jgi:hypothetical protein
VTHNPSTESPADASWLTRELPPFKASHRRTEADYYGASALIATASGYASPPRSIASWKHGVLFETELTYPQLMLTEGNRFTRHLVANGSQVTMLKRGAYLRVHAVGAPYLYVEAAPAPRMGGSLLVMPAHSLLNSRHAFDERAYVGELQAIRNRFSTMVACISPPCVREGLWTHEFEQAGIPWIPGADSSDGNALRRMDAIFSRFDYVTTNVLGSHVAYAAYSGCKVSIWGPYARYRAEDYKHLPWYRKHGSRTAELVEAFSEAHVRRNNPMLFREPWEAARLAEWAAHHLGLEHKRRPEETATLLGWSRMGQAEAVVHEAARKCAHIAQAVARKLGPLDTAH